MPASPEETNNSRLPSDQDLDLIAKEEEVKAETSVSNVNTSVADQPNDLPSEPVVHSIQAESSPGKCFKCDLTPLNLCRHCGHEFCGNHRSKYSDQYCYLCIAPDNLGLDYLPLEEEDIDEQGKVVIHRGRRIKLIGEGWPNSMQMVNQLDDEGLEIFIAERQRLLKEAMQTAEYHRITLSHAEFTKEYKRHSKAAKLQRRYAELQQGSVRLSGKTQNLGSKAVKQASEDDKLMKLLGLTLDQFKAFKKVMNKL